MSKQPLVQEIDPGVIEAELNRLLSERRFAGAPQMSAFLKYIVHQTLKGNADRIKAYSVGVDALGKPDSFDAQTDPSVRVLALRLRKTLKTVYSNARDNLAIIELKVGTYVPEFYKPSEGYGDELPSSTNTAVSHTHAGGAKLVVVTSAGDQPGDVFVVKDSIAAKPVRDADTAGQVTLESNLPSRPVKPSNGNVLKRDNHSTAGEIAAQWLTLDKWVIGAAVLILAAAWQVGVNQSAERAGGVGSLQLLPAASSYNESATDVTGVFAQSTLTSVRPIVPTVYIDLANTQSLVDRQLMLMLSSSFVQAGTVSVVRRDESSSKHERSFWPGEYQLVVNGFNVDDEKRVDTQLISLFNGEMLFADSITVDAIENSFSTQDLLIIESMATGIVSLDGPLYRDYCSQKSSTTPIDCPSS